MAGNPIPEGRKAINEVGAPMGDHVVSHQNVPLMRGRHAGPENGACVMELASMLAGEPFSDHPRSVCRVVGALLRGTNDRLDDTARQRLYGYAAEAVGTAGDAAASQVRLDRCAAAVSNTTRRGILGRWLHRELVAPEEPFGPQLEGFVSAVVRSFPKSDEGTRALLALVDDVLAIRPAPATTPSRQALGRRHEVAERGR
jgi:hypothetical protein